MKNNVFEVSSIMLHVTYRYVYVHTWTYVVPSGVSLSCLFNATIKSCVSNVSINITSVKMQ